MKNKIDYIGRVYSIKPEHIVKSKDLKTYKETKAKRGDNASNKKIVAVTVQNRGKKVQVSAVTTKANEQQIKRNQKSLLETTNFKKKSYLDTNTIAKSRKTGKHFEIGIDPLVSKNRESKKITKDDLDKYNKKRKKRYKGLNR